ncbi:class I SAM-dependent methyltransferase [Mycobacterium uberis]|uniref:class I SAM-dependent methyltransferase n=1 Tax=Mycobacterium uberis TaxID=2162698 RepID=UPI000E306027|nr:class I SAM-dependent methyltransferase [Mycobacterium uberis]
MGTTVYELDRPQAIEFKTQTLADLSAASTADRWAVTIDLHHDWQTALKGNDFDSTQPAAWSTAGIEINAVLACPMHKTACSTAPLG